MWTIGPFAFRIKLESHQMVEAIELNEEYNREHRHTHTFIHTNMHTFIYTYRVQYIHDSIVHLSVALIL